MIHPIPNTRAVREERMNKKARAYEESNISRSSMFLLCPKGETTV